MYNRIDPILLIVNIAISMYLAFFADVWQFATWCIFQFMNGTFWFLDKPWFLAMMSLDYPWLRNLILGSNHWLIGALHMAAAFLFWPIGHIYLHLHWVAFCLFMTGVFYYVGMAWLLGRTYVES